MIEGYKVAHIGFIIFSIIMCVAEAYLTITTGSILCLICAIGQGFAAGGLITLLLLLYFD